MHHANVLSPQRALMEEGDKRISLKHAYCEFGAEYGVYVLITNSELKVLFRHIFVLKNHKQCKVILRDKAGVHMQLN